MPSELLRIGRDITWLRTTVRRCASGIETEFEFIVADGRLTVVIDKFADAEFLHEVLQTDCLAILEYSALERGWIEHDRYDVRINDNDDVALAKVRSAAVRWDTFPTKA